MFSTAGIFPTLYNITNSFQIFNKKNPPICGLASAVSMMQYLIYKKQGVKKQDIKKEKTMAQKKLSCTR